MNPVKDFFKTLGSEALGIKQMTFPTTPRLSSFFMMPRAANEYKSVVGDGTNSSVIMACINWLSRTFPEAPMEIAILEDDRWKPMVRHPMLSLVSTPNPFYSGIDLWQATIADLHVSGNAYWLVERDEFGVPVELWYAPSVMVEPKGNRGTFITHYEYQPDPSLKPEERDNRDVIHFRIGFDANNLRKGRSPLATVLREVFTDEEASIFTAALLKNLGIPGVIISPGANDIEIDEDSAQALKEDFKQKFGGNRRGEPLVMGTSTHVQVLSFSPEQLNLRDLRRIPEERVSAVLGIPAMIVGLGAGLERSTFNNVAEAREAVYENTILPLQRSIAETLKTQLLESWVPRDQLDTFKVQFDLSNVRVLQEDGQRLAQRNRVGVASGYRMVAEARASEGLEVRPEDYVYLRQLSTVEVPAGTIRPMPEDGGGTSSTGPSDGGVGSSGANQTVIRDTPVVASRSQSETQLKSYAEDRYPHMGHYAGVYRAMDDQGLLEKHTKENRVLFHNLAAEADHYADEWTWALDEMFRTISGDIVASIRSKSRVAAGDVKQDDDEWYEILEDIANGTRPVEAILEDDFDAKYLLPIFLVFWKNIARDTYESVGRNIGVSIPWNEDSLDAALLVEKGGTRKGMIDLNRQTRRAVLDAIADGLRDGDSNEEIIKRVSRYVEGDHMYPNIARERGSDAARRYRAENIALTETRFAQNSAAVSAMRKSGMVAGVIISDGPGCGWTFHNDPDLADGSIRTLEEFEAYPLAHPKCVRAPGPIVLKDEEE